MCLYFSDDQGDWQPQEQPRLELFCAVLTQKKKIPALEGFGLYMEERQSVMMKADKPVEDQQDLQTGICTRVLVQVTQQKFALGREVKKIEAILMSSQAQRAEFTDLMAEVKKTLCKVLPGG